MSKVAEQFLKEVRWIIPTCVNCVHFQSLRKIRIDVDNSSEVLVEYCGLDPKQRTPPAKTIAFGCPRFEQDVPF